MKIYLACPYSHPNASVRQLRFLAASRIAGELIRQGLLVYSPITHGHVIGLTSQFISGSWDFWQAHCQSFIAWADAVKVVNIPGLETSIGVRAELALAASRGLPIDILDRKYCLQFLRAARPLTLLSQEEDTLISKT